MSSFYRICGWWVDKSIPPEAPTIFKNLHPYPRTRDSFLMMFGVQAIPHTFTIGRGWRAGGRAHRRRVDREPAEKFGRLERASCRQQRRRHSNGLLTCAPGIRRVVVGP